MQLGLWGRGADTGDLAAFRQGVSLLRAAGMGSPSADPPRLLTQRHVSDCSPFMCGPRLNAAAGSWKQTCLAPRQQKPDPRGSLARPRARSAPRIGPGSGRWAATPSGPAGGPSPAHSRRFFLVVGAFVHGILQARILEWISHALLQGVFLTQGLNISGLSILFH